MWCCRLGGGGVLQGGSFLWVLVSVSFSSSSISGSVNSSVLEDVMHCVTLINVMCKISELRVVGKWIDRCMGKEVYP